jgi:tetratricopeptide (TPR) repeat protein
MVTVAALAAAVTLLSGALRGSRSPGALAAAPDASTKIGLVDSGHGTADTAALVAGLQQRLKTSPHDAQGYALLGLAYQQRARETGDPSWYPRSERALRRALSLAPDNAVAVGGLGSLALSRHRFREALTLGRRALRLAPASARTYGVIGDALLELGRYDQAFRAFNTMAQLKPSVGSYARVSYARELLGRPDDAIAAMRLALEAAADQPEATAWAHVQLGKLYWSIGRIGAAAREYDWHWTSSPAIRTRSTGSRRLRQREAGSEPLFRSRAAPSTRFLFRSSSRSSATSTAREEISGRPVGSTRSWA